ncbi:MAG: formate dehydrogenase subunit alpha [Candidatus Korarchaeota archaeon]
MSVRLHRSICPFCGVGCGFYLLNVEGTIQTISKWIEHEVCEGILCPKGTYSWKLIRHPDRLKKPLLRRGDHLEEVSWHEAISAVATKIRETIKDDPHRAYFVASAKVTNEEAYLYQKFVRVVVGTNNVDHCVRLCHAATLEGLSSIFGMGVMTNPINDIENAKTIFSIGYNFGDSHPVIFRRVLQAKKNGAKVIVIDPRFNSAAKHADVHIRIWPGTDLVLLAAMINYIFLNGLWDRSFVERLSNVEALKKSVSPYTLEVAEAITKVPKRDIIEITEMVAKEVPTTFLYGMGVTQKINGTEVVRAIASLAAITGNIGRKGAGIAPARGQNNVQGACDMGCLPDRLPGYVRVGSERATEIGAFWGRDLDPLPGIYSSEVFQFAASGKIDYIHILGENPLLSESNIDVVIKGLENAFVVVQDIFLSETAELADVVLPASVWAEKDGTFTNTERRVQLIRRAIDPLPNSLPDLEIIVKIANEFGFHWSSDPSLVFEEIRKIVPFMRGISYFRLEKSPNGVIWPCEDENADGQRILYTDRFLTPDGKAHLPELKVSVASVETSKEFPFVLINGRLLTQYNTGTMSRRIPPLLAPSSKGFAEINPNDAISLGIKHGDRVRIISKIGSVETTAVLTESVPERVVFVPNHFADTPLNKLIQHSIDPISKEPQLKAIPVRIERI